MNTKTIIAAVLMFASISAFANDWSLDEVLDQQKPKAQPDPYAWSGGQIAAEGVALGLLALDYHQTIHFDYPYQYERNPILGSHPTTSRVRTYNIVVAIAQGLGAHYLPEWRNTIIGSTIGIELYATINNKIQNDNVVIPPQQPKPQVISLRANWSFN